MRNRHVWALTLTAAYTLLTLMGVLLVRAGTASMIVVLVMLAAYLAGVARYETTTHTIGDNND